MLWIGRDRQNPARARQVLPGPRPLLFGGGFRKAVGWVFKRGLARGLVTRLPSRERVNQHGIVALPGWVADLLTLSREGGSWIDLLAGAGPPDGVGRCPCAQQTPGSRS